jgi:bifunctional non-homologous end joining protein LigD
LITLVQMGVLEIHPWGSRNDNLERPDRLIFDLDPAPDVRWAAVVNAARELRDRLDRFGLESFVRTTGGKGLHLVAPIARRTTWDNLKQFAKSIAQTMERGDRDKYISVSTKAKRAGKIFVDYLRNDRGATAIASYSSRAREGATVAVPLRWDELTGKLNPDELNVQTVPRRLSALKTDPWAGFSDQRQVLTAAMVRKAARS